MASSGILNVMDFSLSNEVKVISWFNAWPPGKTMRDCKEILCIISEIPLREFRDTYRRSYLN